VHLIELKVDCTVCYQSTKFYPTIERFLNSWYHNIDIYDETWDPSEEYNSICFNRGSRDDTYALMVLKDHEFYCIKYLDFSNSYLWEASLKAIANNKSFISLLEINLYNGLITEDSINNLCQSWTFEGPLIREEPEFVEGIEVATIKIIHSTAITKTTFISANKHKIMYVKNQKDKWKVCDTYVWLRFELVHQKYKYIWR
jgi:hypothetical protein